MTLRHVLLAAVLVLPAGLAHAQDDPRDALIRQLTQRLDRLESEVAALRQSAAATPQATPAMERIAPAGPTVTLSNARPQIALPDGAGRFAVRALFQFDAAAYDQDPGRPVDLASGTNFRRARLGVEGTFNRVWNYNLTTEFGGSGVETPVLNAAWVEYAGWKPWETRQAQPLRLRVGAFATPVNLEDSASNSELLFLERPAAAELTRTIASGDGRSGVALFLNGERWYAHGALTGGVAGVSGESDEQVGYLARFAVLASQGENHAVHLGVNASGVFEPADTDTGPGVAKVVRLRERPELRVDGNRLVDTGAMPADGLSQYGVEAAAALRNFYVAAEGFRFDVERTAAPEASFAGWYVLGSVALTGEKRQWQASGGGFRGIRPSSVFDPAAGTWGAFEVAARYSVLDLNHNQGAPGAALPAGGVRGGEQAVAAVGLNWYPNPVVRFMFDWQRVDIDRLNPAGAQVGEDFNVFSVRSQLNF